MAFVTVQVSGLRELNAKLKTLDSEVQKKVMGQATRAAAMPILHAARSKAPVDTGLLVSTLHIKAKTSRKKGKFTAIIEATGDFKGDAFYASFLEYGHRIGARRRERGAVARRIARNLRREARNIRLDTGGQFGLAPKGSAFRKKQEAFFAREGQRLSQSVRPRGEVEPKPFMRPAFDETKERSVRILIDTAIAGILEIAGGQA